MSRGSIVVTVSLHEHEAHGVVCLLHDVKAGDSVLRAAAASILGSRGSKRLQALGFNVNVNVHNQHARTLPQRFARSQYVDSTDLSDKEPLINHRQAPEGMCHEQAGDGEEIHVRWDPYNSL